MARKPRTEWAEWWRKLGEAELGLILWAVWDPIGDVPLDEYSNYCGVVGGLLRDGAERERIASELSRIRTSAMALNPKPEVDLAAAEKLLQWHYWSFEFSRQLEGSA